MSFDTPGVPNPGQPQIPMGQPATADQRRRNLAQAVQTEVAGGWRVESQTDESAVVVKGGQTNHVLHLILTIITCSAWGLVWIAMAIINRRQAVMLRVDEFGNILRSQM